MDNWKQSNGTKTEPGRLISRTDDHQPFPEAVLQKNYEMTEVKKTHCFTKGISHSNKDFYRNSQINSYGHLAPPLKPEKLECSLVKQLRNRPDREMRETRNSTCNRYSRMLIAVGSTDGISLYKLREILPCSSRDTSNDWNLCRKRMNNEEKFVPSSQHLIFEPTQILSSR